MIDRSLPRDLITAHPYAGDDHDSPWELAEREDLATGSERALRDRYAEPCDRDPDPDFPGCVQ